MESIRGPLSRLRSGAVALLVAVAVAAAVTGGYLALHGRALGSAAANGTPPGRSEAAMAYDADTHDLVMFGGLGSAGRPIGDTWLWDGSGWSEESPASSPPARFEAEMAWDAKSRRVLLLGGTGGAGCGVSDGQATPAGACRQLQDAWAWDGNDWTQVPLGQQLGTRTLAGASMATDPATGEVLLLTSSASASSSTAPGSGQGSGQATANSATVLPGVSGQATGASGAQAIACPMLPASPQPTASPFVCPPLPCRVVGGTAASPDSTCRICPPMMGAPASNPTPQAVCNPCPGAALCIAPAPSITWAFDGGSFHEVGSPSSSAPSPGGNLVWFPSLGRIADVRFSPMMESPTGAADAPAFPCAQGQPCPPFTAGVWEWDGAGWTSASVTAGRGAPAFASPPVTDLSTGDALGLDFSGGTWLAADPAHGWSDASAAHRPTPRSGAAIAFDAATGQVVLFGGGVQATSRTGIQLAGDTWSWDGRDWTHRGGTLPPSPPSPSILPAPAASGSTNTPLPSVAGLPRATLVPPSA